MIALLIILPIALIALSAILQYFINRKSIAHGIEDAAKDGNYVINKQESEKSKDISSYEEVYSEEKKKMNDKKLGLNNKSDTLIIN